MNATNNSNYITENDESKPPQPDIANIAKQYLESDGSVCPFCQSSKIEGMERKGDDSNYQLVVCHTCGEQWTDIYQLVGMEYEGDEHIPANTAPELLDALKAVLKWMDDNPPAKGKKNDLDATYRNACFYRERETARAAIAKAKGE